MQCDQIGRNLTIWATLGLILPNKFSPKQAVSKHDILALAQNFVKSNFTHFPSKDFPSHLSTFYPKSFNANF
jgi:hypothetical protein